MVWWIRQAEADEEIAELKKRIKELEEKYEYG